MSDLLRGGRSCCPIWPRVSPSEQLCSLRPSLFPPCEPIQIPITVRGSCLAAPRVSIRSSSSISATPPRRRPSRRPRRCRKSQSSSTQKAATAYRESQCLLAPACAPNRRPGALASPLSFLRLYRPTQIRILNPSPERPSWRRPQARPLSPRRLRPTTLASPRLIV